MGKRGRERLKRSGGCEDMSDMRNMEASEDGCKFKWRCRATSRTRVVDSKQIDEKTKEKKTLHLKYTKPIPYVYSEYTYSL